MITAGLGLSSPQLALMLTAGYLVLIDATAGAPPDPNEVITAPPAALEQTLADLATRLGLPAPVSLEPDILQRVPYVAKPRSAKSCLVRGAAIS